MPPTPISEPALPRSLYPALAAWVLLVVVAFGLLLDYGVTGGAQAQAPRRWPADALVALDPERPTLLLFAHPHCPCTRATLAELARLQADVGDRVRLRVRFLLPEGRPQEWAHTDLWSSARAIPGADVALDPGGTLASRFGVATSGQMLVYGRGGQLHFAGGLTPTRGHQGESLGRRAVLALLSHEPNPAPTGRVFGCALGAAPGASVSYLEATERRLAGLSITPEVSP